jgi:Skp family chaperone for outer membrane proteins
MARNAIEAFREYDNVLNALAAELQKKLDEAEAEDMKMSEAAAKSQALKNATQADEKHKAHTKKEAEPQAVEGTVP